MLFKYWVVCLLLFILFIQARASSFMPAVTNYLAKDYEAGYQNWACAQGSNGEMYFGNSQGLLVYDGYRWTLHKVPGNHIVRSVYVKEDRIYVGAFEEFGYFKYSEAGTLRYHSLSKFLKNFPMENNEIWNIVELVASTSSRSAPGSPTTGRWYTLSATDSNSRSTSTPKTDISTHR